MESEASEQSKQVTHLIMMSANAVKEKDQREKQAYDRKKVQPINSDLGDIIENKQKPIQMKRLFLSTPPGNDIYNIRPVLSWGNVDSCLNSSNAIEASIPNIKPNFLNISESRGELK